MNYLSLLSKRRFINIFILGALSGMPMAFFFTALVTWLTDMNVDISLIGTFALARLPYSFKYIWAPMVDNFRLPFIHQYGHRKSWMLISIFGVAFAIFLIKFCSKDINYFTTLYLACAVGFFGATYDIVFDAYRIESLSEEEQAFGGAITIFGYRIGMLVISYGVLYLSHSFSWTTAYIYMILIFMVGIFFIILLKEENISIKKGSNEPISFKYITKLITEPFYSIVSKRGSITILCAISLYKLGEALLSAMTTPFYMEIGFSKIEIANISKVYGVIATLIGVYIGAIISKKYGNLKSLLICGFGQMISNLMFVWQHSMGHDNGSLMITLTVENITGGMGSVALVGYMSALCNKKYTATHYATLSSITSLANNTIAASSGWLVKNLGWDQFFILTTIVSLPSLLIIFYISRAKPGDDSDE